MRLGGKSVPLDYGVFARSKRWRYTLKPLVTFRVWALAVVRRHPKETP